MENAPSSSERPRKSLTHQEAKDASKALRGRAINDPEYSEGFIIGDVATEEGFVVVIGVPNKDFEDNAKNLAKKYIPGIPYEVHITGFIQAG